MISSKHDATQYQTFCSTNNITSCVHLSKGSNVVGKRDLISNIIMRIFPSQHKYRNCAMIISDDHSKFHTKRVDVDII